MDLEERIVERDLGDLLHLASSVLPLGAISYINHKARKESWGASDTMVGYCGALAIEALKLPVYAGLAILVYHLT